MRSLAVISLGAVVDSGFLNLDCFYGIGSWAGYLLILGTCMGSYQKRHGVKTGGSASMGGDFSLVSVIGGSFFHPFYDLSS